MGPVAQEIGAELARIRAGQDASTTSRPCVRLEFSLDPVAGRTIALQPCTCPSCLAPAELGDHIDGQSDECSSGSSGFLDFESDEFDFESDEQYFHQPTAGDLVAELIDVGTPKEGRR